MKKIYFCTEIVQGLICELPPPPPLTLVADWNDDVMR